MLVKPIARGTRLIDLVRCLLGLLRPRITESSFLRMQSEVGLKGGHAHPGRAEGEVEEAVSRGHVPVLHHLLEFVLGDHVVRRLEHVHVGDEARFLLQDSHVEADDDVVVIRGAYEEVMPLPILLDHLLQLRYHFRHLCPARDLRAALSVEAAVPPRGLEGRGEDLGVHEPLLAEYLVPRALERVHDVLCEVAGDVLVLVA
mmetsp:Transcript_26844/g.72405  ORF Transcript_26844/g.72405 Transcript_26844/m.72405 type:complete len:201 (-) Transcript_26844:47-649(-)